MNSYRPAVGWAHLILGVLTLLPAVVLPVVFALLWSATPAEADPELKTIIGVSFAVVAFVLVALLVGGCLSLVAGLGVLRRRRWGDVAVLVASLLNLVSFPFGTAVGAFSLWVVLVREPAKTAFPTA